MIWVRVGLGVENRRVIGLCLGMEQWHELELEQWHELELEQWHELGLKSLQPEICYRLDTDFNLILGHNELMLDVANSFSLILKLVDSLTLTFVFEFVK